MARKRSNRPIDPADIPFDHHPQAPPVIEHPDLPEMDAVRDVSSSRKPSEGATIMSESPDADGGGSDRMDSVQDQAQVSASIGVGLGQLRSQVVTAGRAAFPDQKRAAIPGRQKRVTEGYVRLRVRAENGALTVLSAKRVEGPLVQSPTVGSGYVYEVTVGGSRVAFEWLPDAGVSRAFANIERPEAHLGHAPRELESFEFTARVPLEGLTPDALPQVRIALHRITTPPDHPITAEPFAAQLGDAVTEVARLPSLELERLDTQAREDLNRILQSQTPPD